MEGGIVATFEATRFATGRRNALRIEVNGSKGSAAFDFERMNELEFFDNTDPTTEQGFRRIVVTEPEHPYMSAWWPPGHGIGYEHTFTHQARDFLEAVGTGADPTPSFDDALQIQLVLDTVLRSAANNSAWTSVPEGASS
jgi:predicted dehydrogenase